MFTAAFCVLAPRLVGIDPPAACPVGSFPDPCPVDSFPDPPCPGISLTLGSLGWLLPPASTPPFSPSSASSCSSLQLVALSNLGWVTAVNLLLCCGQASSSCNLSGRFSVQNCFGESLIKFNVSLQWRGLVCQRV